MAEQLKLRFLGSLIEQIGRQMYPSATASVAELISNAWDADARNVWVTIPFGEGWRPESELVVLDDGRGMSPAAAQEKYLLVGRKRREEERTDRSPSGRALHGRKGLGKLAAFGTARVLELTTRADGITTSFRLDYDRIRSMRPAEDYDVEVLEPEALANPQSGSSLETGTRIRLTGLLLRQPVPEDRFIASMSRRFALSSDEMQVSINGHQLARFAIPTAYRFPGDGRPNDPSVVERDGWFEERVDPNDEASTVRWWIGFTPTPIEDESMAGVSVLAHQKMVQRPFWFAQSQGTEGQLGEKYLVGEVHADWLDRGYGIEDDLIQANRDQLQLEDARLATFLAWGRRRLEWALRQRQRLRREANESAIEEDPEIERILEGHTPTERRIFRQIGKSVATLPEIDADQVRDLMREVVTGFEDKAVRELMERLNEEDEPFQARFWSLVHEFGLIDARRNLSIIEARIATIESLRAAVRQGATEVPEMHTLIAQNPWLLDPRWYLLDEEVTLTDIPELARIYTPNQEEGLRLDFLFVLSPRPPATADEVVVVEIKRGTYANGRLRRADLAEVNKFNSYVLAVRRHYSRETFAPTVRGVMIAQAFADDAEDQRRMLEQVSDPKMEFKSWDRVIDDTHRMHLGWLAVVRRRTEAGTTGAAATDSTTD